MAILKPKASATNATNGALERIPLFLKVREMELYFLLVSDKPENLDEWCQRFMRGRRERIEKEMPIIDIDFSRYA